MSPTSVLPLYSLPSCAPSYSTIPLADEETIEYTPRPGRSSFTLRNFVRQWQQTTLLLKNQDDAPRLPTYGRAGIVEGELGIGNPEKVAEVSIKFEGTLSVVASDNGGRTVTTFAQKIPLWKGTPEQNCPSILPFIMQFPLCYGEDGRTYKLPPTFEATFLGIPALFARSIYTLTVSITRQRLGSWTTSKSYTLPLVYLPRSRPHRPAIQFESIFLSIKPVPEEWLQLVHTMQTTPNSKLKPIDCHFLIPSLQTFPVHEGIPFHIQLCSSVASIRELLPPSSSLLEPSKDCLSEDKTQHGEFAVRVCIIRQVTVEINGRKQYRTATIGSAKLRPVPPLVIRASDAKIDSSDEVCVDWEGQAHCLEEVKTGGFRAGHLFVKDFLVLSLTPPNSWTSSLLPLQVSHPIRLVTDSWGDSYLHPQDI